MNNIYVVQLKDLSVFTSVDVSSFSDSLFCSLTF